MASLSRIVEYRPTRLVVLATHLGLALASLGLWVVAYTQGLSWRADFTAFYTGWTLVMDGEGRSLYDYGLQASTQQRILEGRHLAGGLLAFNYPPHVALLFAPLSNLELGQAYIVWTMLQVGLLVCVCRVLWRHLSQEGVGTSTRWLVVSAVLALPFVGSTLLLGAFSILLLLCVLGFVLAVRRGDARSAGLWVVLMTLKPQVAFLPAFTLIVSRRWKAVGVLACGGLLIFALTSLCLGGQIWISFAKALLTTLNADVSLGVAPSAMYNLRGLCETLLGNRFTAVANTVGLLGFLVSVILTLWLWSGAEPRCSDFDLRMSMTLLLGIFLNLHVNPQDGLLLVVPAMLFWHYLRRVGRHSQLFGGIALVCPVIFWVTERFISAPMLGLRSPVVVMIALGIWMLHESVHAAHTRHAEIDIA